MTEIASICPMDHVLPDETRTRIMRGFRRSGFRRILSAPGSDIEEVEIAEGLPLDVDVILLTRFEDNSMHADILHRDE